MDIRLLYLCLSTAFKCCAVSYPSNVACMSLTAPSLVPRGRPLAIDRACFAQYAQVITLSALFCAVRSSNYIVPALAQLAEMA